MLLAYWLERAPPVVPSAKVVTPFVYPAPKVAQVSWDPATGAITPDTQLPSWVFTTKLVAKPDQLIKRRGKAGLLALNKTWDEAKPWIAERAGKPQKVRAQAQMRIDRLWGELARRSAGSRALRFVFCDALLGLSRFGGGGKVQGAARCRSCDAAI